MKLRTTLRISARVHAGLCRAVAATKQVDDNVLYDTVRRKLANDQVVKGGALEVEVKGWRRHHQGRGGVRQPEGPR